MAYYFQIGKREIEVDEEKFDKIMDKAYAFCKGLSVACVAFAVGYTMGDSAGAKRGCAVGILTGAAAAYENVIEMIGEVAKG
jgi:succinate-acetate transporter protein